MRDQFKTTDAIQIVLNPVEEPKEPEAVIRVKGFVEAIVKDELTGEIKQRVRKPNLIVTSGIYGIAEQLVASPGISKPSHMAIGTNSSVAPAASQTALVSEVGTRVSLASLTRNTSVISMVATFPAGNPSSSTVIREAGIFNSATGGVMYSRIVFGDITKNTTDSLQLTWTYTFSAS